MFFLFFYVLLPILLPALVRALVLVLVLVLVLLLVVVVVVVVLSRNFFNWIDFLVVCSSWTELFAAGLPISPTFLRMLRLGKLLRALRVVKMSQVGSSWKSPPSVDFGSRPT